MRLLQRDIARRYPSARDVQKALRPILEEARIFDLRGAIREYLVRVNDGSTGERGDEPPRQATPASRAPQTLQLLSAPKTRPKRSRRALYWAIGIVLWASTLAFILILFFSRR
jgi:hypothetical protein